MRRHPCRPPAPDPKPDPRLSTTRCLHANLWHINQPKFHNETNNDTMVQTRHRHYKQRSSVNAETDIPGCKIQDSQTVLFKVFWIWDPSPVKAKQASGDFFEVHLFLRNSKLMQNPKARKPSRHCCDGLCPNTTTQHSCRRQPCPDC